MPPVWRRLPFPCGPRLCPPFTTCGRPEQNDARSERRERVGGSPVFAALASLESFLKPAEAWDFSEHHLRAGAPRRRLARTPWWAPWPAGPTPSAKPTIRGRPPVREDAAVKHVQNVAYLPPRTAALDNDRLKQAAHGLRRALGRHGLSSLPLTTPPQAAYYNAGTEGETTGRGRRRLGRRLRPDEVLPPASRQRRLPLQEQPRLGLGQRRLFLRVLLRRASWPAAISAPRSRPSPRSGYTVQYAYDPNGCTSRLGFDSGNRLVRHPVHGDIDRSFGRRRILRLHGRGRLRSVRLPRPRPGPAAERHAWPFARRDRSPLRAMTIPLTASVPLLLNQRFSVVVKLQTDGDDSPDPPRASGRRHRPPSSRPIRAKDSSAPTARSGPI